MAALSHALESLAQTYGQPEPPSLTDPLGMILWENVAYLLGDKHREAAYQALEQTVGISPEAIAAAPDETLLDVASRGGMRPVQRVAKLRQIADLVLQDFGGDLRIVLSWPLRKAVKAFKKF